MNDFLITSTACHVLKWYQKANRTLKHIANAWIQWCYLAPGGVRWYATPILSSTLSSRWPSVLANVAQSLFILAFLDEVSSTSSHDALCQDLSATASSRGNIMASISSDVLTNSVQRCPCIPVIFYFIHYHSLCIWFDEQALKSFNLKLTQKLLAYQHVFKTEKILEGEFQVHIIWMCPKRRNRIEEEETDKDNSQAFSIPRIFSCFFRGSWSSGFLDSKSSIQIGSPVSLTSALA